MLTASLVLALIAAAFILFKVIAAIPGTSIYAPAGPLFSRAEVVFYNALVRAVGDQYQVFGKVRVADLVKVKGDSSNKSSLIARNKIAQKHVDFVLVNKDDLSPVCVLELNDNSHIAKDRKSRDAFLSSLFARVDLPLLWIPATNRYDTASLRSLILGAVAAPVAPSRHAANQTPFRHLQKH